MAGNDLYVSLSAQVALEKRMDTIANNVANMNTAGVRAGGVKFDALLSHTGSDSVAYASSGEAYISRDPGPMNFTGNSLDAAIGGDGWFALQSPAGTVYTRDGRFHMSDTGELQSVKGYPVLDPGGGQITLDPSAGPVTISQDGAISQNGKQLAAIGLYIIPPDAKLTRSDNSAVRSSLPATQAEDLTSNTVRQGYVEGANVNPIIEMTRLIAVTRAFDDAVAAIQQSDTKSDDAIRTLGPS
jgi:flagellar basal-body rod protein FlgF